MTVATPVHPGNQVAPADQAAAARAARRELMRANDEQVLKVLKLVESLRERGQADELLAPLRGRLRELRPARPIRLTRLLFMPLDMLVVDAREWRAGTPLVPRTALAPLAGIVRTSLGAHAEALDGALAAISNSDSAKLHRIGSQLWPKAGDALASAPTPPDWKTQGLPEAAFVPMRDAVAFMLRKEPELLALKRGHVEPAALEHSLERVLGEARSHGASCWGMLLAVLLQRFPEAETPMRVAVTTFDADGADMAATAIHLATDWIEAAAKLGGAADLEAAAGQVALQVALLDRLANEPSQRTRAVELRLALHAGCSARFESALQTDVTAHLAGEPDPAAILAVEATARNLRRLEVEARRLGGGATYDQRLRDVADNVMVAPQWAMPDRIRLIEILAGAPLALQKLRSAATTR